MEPAKQVQAGTVVAAMCTSGCQPALDLSDCVSVSSADTKEQLADPTKDLSKTDFNNVKDPLSRQRRALGEKDAINGGTKPEGTNNNMCTMFTQINVCVQTKIAGCAVLEQSYTTSMKPFLQEMVPYCGSEVVDGPTSTPGVVEVTTKDNGVLIDNGLGNNGASGISAESFFFLFAAALSILLFR